MAAKGHFSAPPREGRWSPGGRDGLLVVDEDRLEFFNRFRESSAEAFSC
jgi:hypothetical protein